ncbi:hypothetical protein VNI00_016841 [Paramarasmius palmivorus]|uniref:Uncharacterized protein n=1 Tax=Paramarasmius palmivorus TaxID=297713 RepID=A0AAW0B9Y9_9AGAR
MPFQTSNMLAFNIEELFKTALHVPVQSIAPQLTMLPSFYSAPSTQKGASGVGEPPLAAPSGGIMGWAPSREPVVAADEACNHARTEEAPAHRAPSGRLMSWTPPVEEPIAASHAEAIAVSSQSPARSRASGGIQVLGWTPEEPVEAREVLTAGPAPNASGIRQAPGAKGTLMSWLSEEVSSEPLTSQDSVAGATSTIMSWLPSEGSNESLASQDSYDSDTEYEEIVYIQDPRTKTKQLHSVQVVSAVPKSPTRELFTIPEEDESQTATPDGTSPITLVGEASEQAEKVGVVYVEDIDVDVTMAECDDVVNVGVDMCEEVSVDAQIENVLQKALEWVTIVEEAYKSGRIVGWDASALYVPRIPSLCNVEVVAAEPGDGVANWECVLDEADALTSTDGAEDWFTDFQEFCEYWTLPDCPDLSPVTFKSEEERQDRAALWVVSRTFCMDTDMDLFFLQFSDTDTDLWHGPFVTLGLGRTSCILGHFSLGEVMDFALLQTNLDRTSTWDLFHIMPRLICTETWYGTERSRSKDIARIPYIPSYPAIPYCSLRKPWKRGRYIHVPESGKTHAMSSAGQASSFKPQGLQDTMSIEAARNQGQYLNQLPSFSLTTEQDIKN